MNTITFGSVNSEDYGIFVAGPGMYKKPKRKVEYIDIPGKSGALEIKEDAFEDFDMTFQAVIPNDFQTQFDDFAAAINAVMGFQTLTEQRHPNSFWMASFSEVLEPNPTRFYAGATCNIIFHCHPQRYLNSGLAQYNFFVAGTITNPTLYTARPNIRVYGSGTVGIGSQTITIASHSWPYIDIDCEAMDARYEANNANNKVTVTGSDFPTLPAGDTGITLGGNVTRVQIQPRWWTI